MKLLFRDALSLCLLFSIVAVFFARLFYPNQQLLVTPDYGRSDAWHFSMPTKFALSESLKRGELPLWRDDVGMGFPLFAEGQTGALFLPNVILYSLFDWVTAYNLLLAFSIFTLSAGMYFLLRILHISAIGALFGAISTSFSGLPILNLPHVTLLQGMSLLPFIVGAGIHAYRKHTLYHYCVVALLVSQQIFAGFPQSVFLTMCILYTYLLFLSFQTKHYATAIAVFIATIVGLLLASAQLLPSYEFLQQSMYPNGFSQDIASGFSMPLSHLVTFISPFLMGNPKVGTYPPFYQFDGSMFWENTAYLGIFPLLFAGFWFIKTAYTKSLIYIFLIFGSLLFAWGKYSPIYLLYGVWPLTLFRVPSRFLWITTIGIVIVASLQLSAWWNQSKAFRIKILLLFTLFLQTVLLVFTWWSYHLIIPKDLLLFTPPQLPSEYTRFITIGESLLHNRQFVSKGWSHKEAFLPFYQGLSPISNMFWHASQYSVYAGRFLRRQSIYNDIFINNILLSYTEATISASTTSLLSTSGIKEFHSFVPINNATPIKTYANDGKFPLYVYENLDALEEAYIARNATTASTLNQAVSFLTHPSFAKDKSVVVSQSDKDRSKEIQEAFAQIKNVEKDIHLTVNRSSHTKVALTMNPLDVSTILVLSDTYYPDWKATVDGKDTLIFPVNITYRGIVVPKGGQKIIFSYKPTSVTRGIRISILTHALIAILAMYQLMISFVHIQKKDSPPLLRR